MGRQRRVLGVPVTAQGLALAVAALVLLVLLLLALLQWWERSG